MASSVMWIRPKVSQQERLGLLELLVSSQIDDFVKARVSRGRAANTERGNPASGKCHGQYDQAHVAHPNLHHSKHSITGNALAWWPAMVADGITLTPIRFCHQFPELE
jgi:hypothetical protein